MSEEGVEENVDAEDVLVRVDSELRCDVGERSFMEADGD